MNKKNETKLTILSETNLRKHRSIVLECICECGNIVQVKANDFANGHTRSCGCLGKRSGTENPLWTGHQEISGKFWGNIKRSAIKRKFTFDIQIEYAWDLYLLQDKKCKLSGLPITLSGSDKTASLDRINSSNGYIEGNVQWLHKDVNYIKMDLDEEYFINLCQHIANNRLYRK